LKPNDSLLRGSECLTWQFTNKRMIILRIKLEKLTKSLKKTNNEMSQDIVTQNKLGNIQNGWIK